MNSKGKTRILFADSDGDLLQLYERTLAPTADQWEAAYVRSGQSALALMRNNPFDIVVADLDIPKTDGLKLLREVRSNYPQTIRLILSANTSDGIFLKCLGDSHQYLPKPFNLAQFQEILNRIQGVQRRIDSGTLKSLLGRMVSLPSVPAVFFKILEALEDQDASIDEIAGIVSSDPALTAQLLKLVNSAYFGFGQKVTGAGEALQIIGLARVRALVLSLKIFSVFEVAGVPGMSVEQVWRHSLDVAQVAQKIAGRETGDANLAEEAFTAGLLHDIGKLILASNFSKDYANLLNQVNAGHASLVALEQEFFAAAHPDVGAYLLGIWGLPVSLVEAVALHHQPNLCSAESFTSLTAVHAANALVNSNAVAKMPGSDATLNVDYLQRLNLDKQVTSWERYIRMADDE